MDEIFRDFLVTFIIVAAFFGIVYVFFMTRHRERLLLIERGLDMSNFPPNKNMRWVALKFGVLFIGIAIGILVGNVLSEYLDFNEVVSFLSMTFLFGGLGLVSYFFIESNYKKK
ncbi:MAG: DUF6249 domain-containing protein [Cellulophaga sp.]